MTWEVSFYLFAKTRRNSAHRGYLFYSRFTRCLVLQCIASTVEEARQRPASGVSASISLVSYAWRQKKLLYTCNYTYRVISACVVRISWQRWLPSFYTRK